MKYRLLILLFAGCLFGCKSKAQKIAIKPEAIKLNKIAMDTLIKGADRVKALAAAVTLLNKATEIDSNYFIGYSNKFSYQTELKEYDKALITGKRMMKLRPNNVTIKMQVGIVYEKTGDKVAAIQCYNQGLSIYDKLLDTMNVNNPAYKELLFEKASDLVLLHQEQKGYSIMRELYDKEANTDIKQMYKQYINMSREDMISGKGETMATISENVNVKN